MTPPLATRDPSIARSAAGIASTRSTCRHEIEAFSGASRSLTTAASPSVRARSSKSRTLVGLRVGSSGATHTPLDSPARNHDAKVRGSSSKSPMRSPGLRPHPSSSARNAATSSRSSTKERTRDPRASRRYGAEPRSIAWRSISAPSELGSCDVVAGSIDEPSSTSFDDRRSA